MTTYTAPYANAHAEAQTRLNFELDLETHRRMEPPANVKCGKPGRPFRLVPVDDDPAVDWRVEWE